LGQERGLEADFGAYPFALGVGLIWGVIAAAATAELWPEVGGLDLIEVVEFFPSSIADGVGNVDFEFQEKHVFKV